MDEHDERDERDPIRSVDQFLGMVDAARAVFALFQAYTAAGFTETQALKLLGYVMTAGRQT